MENFMQCLIVGILLAGCASDDYFGDVPPEYLIDESGHYIDKDGNRVDKPVRNPYRDEFDKSRANNSSSTILIRIPPKTSK